MRPITFPTVMAAGLLLAACSSGGSATPTPTADWAVTNCAQIAAPVIESAPAPQSQVEGSVAVAGAADAAPVVSIAADAAPATALVSVDLIEGSGTPVPPGAGVTVQYCGVGLTTRTIFDSSWSRGEPITFPLDGVIAGWQEGMPGMKPGGRRLLVIPGSLAYGPNPPSADILPDETLVFVVDLLAVAG